MFINIYYGICDILVSSVHWLSKIEMLIVVVIVGCVQDPDCRIWWATHIPLSIQWHTEQTHYSEMTSVNIQWQDVLT